MSVPILYKATGEVLRVTEAEAETMLATGLFEPVAEGAPGTNVNEHGTITAGADPARIEEYRAELAHLERQRAAVALGYGALGGLIEPTDEQLAALRGPRG